MKFAKTFFKSLEHLFITTSLNDYLCIFCTFFGNKLENLS